MSFLYFLFILSLPVGYICQIIKFEFQNFILSMYNKVIKRSLKLIGITRFIKNGIVNIIHKIINKENTYFLIE